MWVPLRRAVEPGAEPWHRMGSRRPNDGGCPKTQIVLEIPEELKAVGEMCVDHGVFHAHVTDPVLNKAEIGSGIKLVRHY
jgi:hypothetical protein